MGFADSIKKSRDKIVEQVNDKMLETATSLFSAIVKDTPKQPYARYSKGLLINNWFTASDTFSTATNPTADMSGSSSYLNIQALKDSTAFLGKDGFVSMSNNLSYAYRAEYLGWPREDNPAWTGRVKPYGMVTMNLRNYGGKVIR